MSERHRQTASDWHGGEWSALYAYASASVVLRGIDDEIWDCLATVERGDLDSNLDSAEEHERLGALLHHVEPELAAEEARLLAESRARNAVAWWQQDVLGDRTTGERSVVARRILRGIEEGDPAVLQTLPGPRPGYTPGQLAADCCWPEPVADDREAHDRWSKAQGDIWDAYTTAFADEVQKQVAQSCDDVLAEEAVDPPRPYIRRVADRTVGEESADHGATPPGSIVELLGEWSGTPSEVVYDPRRFEVVVTLYPGQASASASLEARDWEHLASDRDRSVSVRDRGAAARATLDRPMTADFGDASVPGLEL